MFCLTLVISLSLCFPAFAQTLTFYKSVSDFDESYTVFRSHHPELDYAWNEEYYANTSELAGKLMTHELNADILGIWSNTIDIKRIMSKGYLLDLSGNNSISAFVEGAVPAIRDAITHDGKIYALPETVLFDYWEADEKAWEEAGLDIADAPNSYPELLDFLDGWCDRIENEPEYDIRVVAYWDATVYDSSAYTALLTEMLIQSAVMQERYAGENVSFQTDEISALLERAKKLGKRIYELEPAIATTDERFGFSLFNHVTRPKWLENSENIVSLRLNDNQPEIVGVILVTKAVNSATELPN